MNSIHALIWKNKKMDKYKQLNGNFFGFEVFEEILKALQEKSTIINDSMFITGLLSAEHIVKEIRDEYYEALKHINDEPTS